MYTLLPWSQSVCWRYDRIARFDTVVFCIAVPRSSTLEVVLGISAAKPHSQLLKKMNFIIIKKADPVSLSSTLNFAIVSSMYFDNLSRIRHCQCYPCIFRFHSPGYNPWRGCLPVAKRGQGWLQRCQDLTCLNFLQPLRWVSQSHYLLYFKLFLHFQFTVHLNAINRGVLLLRRSLPTLPPLSRPLTSRLRAPLPTPPSPSKAFVPQSPPTLIDQIE